MSNDYRAYIEYDYNSIYHHGIKGMKWGIRRYQNPDGTLTPEGRKRYFNPDGSLTKAGKRELKRRYNVRNSIGIAAGGALGTAIAGNVGKIAASRTTKRDAAAIEELKKWNPERKMYEFVKPTGKYDFVKYKNEGSGTNSKSLNTIRKFFTGDLEDGSNNIKSVVRNIDAKDYDGLSKENQAKFRKQFGKPVKRFDKVKVDADFYDRIREKYKHDLDYFDKRPLAEKNKYLDSEFIPREFGKDYLKEGYKKHEYIGRGTEYNRQLSQLNKSRATRGKIIAGAIIAAGLGATAYAVYKNEKRKRQMAQNGEAEVNRMLKGQSSSITKQKKTAKSSK